MKRKGARRRGGGGEREREFGPLLLNYYIQEFEYYMIRLSSIAPAK